ncbi:MAG: pyruvate kinase [Chthoniobacterales bacterium]|nr:pyruvate kinase [Chthoniobacterales bacterium]
MRSTKIICTLGPATDSPEILREMILAGTNIFRLNMSHGTHEWVRAIVKKIRKAASDLDAVVAILLDTQGPAIRTGDLANKLNLKPGDIFEFTVRGARSEEQFSTDVNYDGLVDDISVGDVVLVDNGVMHMKVLHKNSNRIRCEVLTAGTLGSRRHINLPGVKVNLPPLTEKDLADIEVGVEVGVDFVALSFCREAADIIELKRLLRERGSQARTVAKIEDQHAVKFVNDIIRASDAVMIARGDLGIECAMEELPIIQRRIIKKCIQIGRPVIVATHMLESMIENPLPTRAEITDVANAVYEQADAIMLSGETTVGKYPVQCVKILDRVARRIARSGGAGYAKDAIVNTTRMKTMRSAVTLANSFSNSKIIVFTRHGYMADHASHLRPDSAPIFAFSPSAEVVRRLALSWNVHPILMSFGIDPEHTIADAEVELTRRGLAVRGDQLIILSDVMVGTERFDSIQLRQVI